MEKIIINGTIIMNNGPNKGLIYSEDNGKTWHYSRIMKNDNYSDHDVKEDNDIHDILNSLRNDLLSIFNEVDNYAKLDRRAVNDDQYIIYIIYIHSQIKDIVTRYQFSENEKVKTILIELLKLL